MGYGAGYFVLSYISCAAYPPIRRLKLNNDIWLNGASPMQFHIAS